MFFYSCSGTGSLASTARPRRLKPISPPLHKKKKKHTRKPHQSLPPAAPDPFPPSKTPPLMNQSMLSQLMAKMEEPDIPPTVTPAPSTPFSPQYIVSETPPPPSQALDPAPVDVGHEGSQSVEPKHKKKRRRRPRAEHGGVAMEAQKGVAMESQEGAVLEPQGSKPQEGVDFETQEGVLENEDPIPPVMGNTLSPMSAG